MRWIDVEKPALVETLRTRDPDAPTLCEGWDTRRLLAHLVQREQHQLANTRDMISKRPPGQEVQLSRLVDTALSPEGYQALVEEFANGPRPWSAMSWAAESLNFLEYLIHHEDLRRALPDPAEPRALPRPEQQAVWQRLRRLAGFSFRRAPVGVNFATPDGAHGVVRKADEEVVLTGEPLELLLYVSGRRTVARLEISGDPHAVERFEAWATSR
jgi:uncharacterized protein (TIGR03085 family)